MRFQLSIIGCSTSNSIPASRRIAALTVACREACPVHTSRNLVTLVAPNMHVLTPHGVHSRTCGTTCNRGITPLRNVRGRNKARTTRLAGSHDVPEAVLSTGSYSRTANNVMEIAEACCSKSSVVTPSVDPASIISPTTLAIAGGLALTAYGIKKIYDTPSRAYDENVGDEYDAWSSEGILEYYWGEHIHLGYYSDEERAAGAWNKNFIQAKFDFVDEMLAFAKADKPLKIVDVGCGIGGTSRHVAKLFPEATVTGMPWLLRRNLSCEHNTKAAMCFTGKTCIVNGRPPLWPV
jgi:hypothetical protein